MAPPSAQSESADSVVVGAPSASVSRISSGRTHAAAAHAKIPQTLSRYGQRNRRPSCSSGSIA